MDLRMKTKMLTEQFTSSDELGVVRRKIVDACLDALPDELTNHIDRENDWVLVQWHDDLLTETQVSGVIPILDKEYMFVFDFVTSTLIRIFENPVDEYDPGIDEPEESVPYRLWNNDGTAAAKPNQEDADSEPDEFPF